MPPKPLFDLDSVDLSRVVAGPEQIRRLNPQRYEMEHLDAIIYHDPDAEVIIGRKDVREDEFWARGHIPGRPLMPGVILCEAAAQLCSYYYKSATRDERFFGFGGLDDVRFRAAVNPGETLVLVARCKRMSRRHASFDVQAFVGSKMVFEGVIIGMPV